MPSQLRDLTVGHLRELLADQSIPDDLPVGCCDHYGDFIQFAYLPEVSTARRQYTPKPSIPCLVFEAVNIGEEPD